jgi:hypothetical protein
MEFPCIPLISSAILLAAGIAAGGFFILVKAYRLEITTGAPSR